MSARFIFEWLILILLFGLGIYTLWIIKNEKRTYLKKAQEVLFKKFKLLVPHWWSEVERSENLIVFQRTDTRYEWTCTLQWLSSSSGVPIVDLFKAQIHERHILFDEETSIIGAPDTFKDRPLVKSGEFEMVRVEGTATKDKEERIYYDAFLIREKGTGEFLYAESKSSVLNGLVEGPYFEEVMNRIEKISF